METVLLKVAGMTFYDALCHAFTTMPTGGFSTKNQGIAAFDSVRIEAIILVFMTLAGASFTLHYQALKGKNLYFFNSEFRSYLSILGIFSLIIFVIRISSTETGLTVFAALRQSVFQVVSIATTTGYATADFDLWPAAAKQLILVLMFIGGCVGSTGGSIKVMRILILIKALLRELYQTVKPRTIKVIKLDGRTITDDTVMSIFCFVLFFFAIFIVGSVFLTFTGMDMVSAISGAATALGNVGPGLGAVGPSSTFADLSPFAKWTLAVMMLLGRLELYTVLAVFYRK